MKKVPVSVAEADDAPAKQHVQILMVVDGVTSILHDGPVGAYQMSVNHEHIEVQFSNPKTEYIPHGKHITIDLRL